jgi:hypothetical protein
MPVLANFKKILQQPSKMAYNSIISTLYFKKAKHKEIE